MRLIRLTIPSMDSVPPYSRRTLPVLIMFNRILLVLERLDHDKGAKDLLPHGSHIAIGILEDLAPLS
jgi:hypothetical protein